MARIRTVKPEFFTSDDVCALSPLARLLYIGLWCEADREGRMVWSPKAFKRRYLPEDECDIEKVCAEILARGLVKLYGDGLACVPTFSKHQHVNPREAASVLPDAASFCAEKPTKPTREARASDASVTRREEGKEGEGKESYSDANASAAPDAATVVFRQGLAWMVERTGRPEAGCRSQLGRWRKEIGDEALIAVLGRGQREGPIDAMAWLEKAVAAHGKGPPRKPWDKPQPADFMGTVEPWEGRLRGYKPGGFWLEGQWGPRPESGKCRAPATMLAAIGIHQQQEASAA